MAGLDLGSPLGHKLSKGATTTTIAVSLGLKLRLVLEGTTRNAVIILKEILSITLQKEGKSF